MENICQSTRKVSNVLDQLLLESTDFPSLFCGTHEGLSLSCLDSNPLESTRLFFQNIHRRTEPSEVATSSYRTFLIYSFTEAPRFSFLCRCMTILFKFRQSKIKTRRKHLSKLDEANEEN